MRAGFKTKYFRRVVRWTGQLKNFSFHKISFTSELLGCVTKSRPKLPQLAVFGANVRRERVARALTQEKLAELMEVNPRTIQKIEAGKLNILLTTILRLQAALGCSWNALMKR